jgi:tetratricopeptide (TPR) repeat protein
MTWVVVIVAAILAGVAAAGVLWPYSRSARVMLERQSDPLEDERQSLLRALRDLDQERAGGMLAEEDYRALRADTEGRAVAVLRALEARDGAGELASGLRELGAAAPSRNGGPAGGGRASRVVPVVISALALSALVGTLLAGALRSREREGAITGSLPGELEATDALAFFEERVLEHPNDVAARLDLAHRYFDSGDVNGATEQYLAALELDPDNAEAQANVGFMLYLAGRAEEGLQAVDRALGVDPEYPEALYFRGVILLEGLDRPDEAATAFRLYLDRAPFGSRRAEVAALLHDIEGTSQPGDT